MASPDKVINETALEPQNDFENHFSENLDLSLDISLDSRQHDTPMISTTKAIRIFYQNANSIKRKHANFFYNTYSEDYDIIIITETWLSEDIGNNELFDNKRYDIYRQDRDPSTCKKRGGGLLFSCKRDYKATPLRNLNICTRENEIMWIKCQIYGQELLFCICYFPPPVSNETVKSFVSNICSDTNLLGKNIMIIGDFNIPEFDDNTNINGNTQVYEIHKLMNTLNLESFNKIKNSNSRTLDLCLTNISKQFSIRRKKTNVNIEKADEGLVKADRHHPPLVINVELQNARNNITNSKNTDIGENNKFNFTNANFTLINTMLAKIQWSDVINLDSKDCNQNLDQFYQKIFEILEQHVPKYKNTHTKYKYPIWWTHDTKMKFKSKERLRKQKNKSTNQQNKYKQLRKLCKSQIKINYQNYVQKMSQNIKKDSSQFWKFYKNRKALSNKKSVQHEGKDLVDPKIIANTFAQHFLKSHNNNTRVPESTASLSPEQIYSNTHLHIEYFTKDDIKKAVQEIPVKKSPGTDGLPPILFKKCLDTLLNPLTNLINQSLREAVYPDKLKESIIKPIPKKGNNVEINNHRPISTLNTLAKIYECALYNKISNFIFSNVSPNQHGFVKQKSTLSNLTEFCDYVARVISEKAQIDVIYSDISKCFDSISHAAIIHKLQSIGFSTPLVQLMKSYLCQRKNQVLFENHLSKPFYPPSGVGQGSKLSSLLFILTFDDIRKHIKNSQFQLYADDLKIYKKITSYNDCILLQEDLNSSQKWLASVGLHFHPNKCFKMTLTTKKNTIQNPYEVNKTPLQNVETFTDLGVTFSSNLNWDAHIDKTIGAANRRLGMVIRCCTPISDIDTITLLYKSIVRSKLEYCSALWTPQTKTQIMKLEKVQANFVRYLFQKINGFYPKYPSNISYKLLIEHLVIDSIESRFRDNQIKFLKNLLTNKINSIYLTSKIDIKVPNPRLRTDPTTLFAVHPNLFKSPIIAAMNVYNNIENKPDLFYPYE